MTTKKSLIQEEKERLKFASAEFWKQLPKIIRQLETKGRVEY